MRFSDPIGINLTNEVGHELLLTETNTEETNNVTSEFYYDINSITTGTVNLKNYNQDRLQFHVKAWDNANNPSEMEILIHISDDNKLMLYNIFNFPNPFSTSTQFTFELSTQAEISLAVYTLGGRKIMEFKTTTFSVGYHTNNWDGHDAFGGVLANGVYLYKIKAENSNATETFVGRCAKFQ